MLFDSHRRRRIARSSSVRDSAGSRLPFDIDESGNAIFVAAQHSVDGLRDLRSHDGGG